MQQRFPGRMMMALTAAAALSGAMALLCTLGHGEHEVIALLAAWVAVSFPLGIAFGHLSLD